MRRIANVTGKPLLQCLLDDNVADLKEPLNEEVRANLTFHTIPSTERISARANNIARVVYSEGFKAALIDGPPYMVTALLEALEHYGIRVFYCFLNKRLCNFVIDGKSEPKEVIENGGFIPAIYDVIKRVKL